MKILTSIGFLALLSSTTLVQANHFPNCQLVGSKDNSTETFVLKSTNNEDVGSITLSIDQPSGQIRFDSYSSHGYRMYDEQIWFDHDPHDLPLDPYDFFMRDAYYPAGATKWIGLWVINPYYCGPQHMYVSVHATVKRGHLDGVEEDAYAYAEGTTTIDNGEEGYIHTESFQLSCTPCDEWQDPEPWWPPRGAELPGDLPSIDEEQQQQGSDSTSLDTAASTTDTGSASTNSTDTAEGSSSDGDGSTSEESSSEGSGSPDDEGTNSTDEVSSSIEDSNGSEANGTGSTSRPIINDTALPKICLDDDHQGAQCEDLLAQVEGDLYKVVGDLCVTVNPVTNLLQVTATSVGNYTMLRGQVWSGTDGIEELPTTSAGAPKVAAFPKYQCLWSGTPKMQWDLRVAGHCSDDSDSLNVTLVVHTLVATKDADGAVVEESKMDAFAAESVVESPIWYGYMTVKVGCDCNTEPEEPIVSTRSAVTEPEQPLVRTRSSVTGPEQSISRTRSAAFLRRRRGQTF